MEGRTSSDVAVQFKEAAFTFLVPFIAVALSMQLKVVPQVASASILTRK